MASLQATTFASALTVGNGGTGATSLTDGGVLLGSSTNAVTAMAVLADGAIIVGNGSTDPVAESGATARASLGAAAADAALTSGLISAFAMAGVPAGWLLCDGAAVSRSTYADLFSAIGVAWGAGNGSSTFNVPELKGAVLRGVGTSDTSNDYVGPALAAGQADQNATHSHTQPTHTHTQPTHTHTQPTHTHTQPTHTHSFSGSGTSGSAHGTMCAGPGGGGWNSGCINGEGRYASHGANYNSGAHTHSISISGTTGSGGGDTTAAGGGDTTAAGGGDTTGSSGNDATGSSGGTENRVFTKGVHYMIKT